MNYWSYARERTTNFVTFWMNRNNPRVYRKHTLINSLLIKIYMPKNTSIPIYLDAQIIENYSLIRYLYLYIINLS